MAQDNWRTYKRLLRYVRPYWYLLALAIVGFLVVAGAEALLARLLGDLIDAMANEMPDAEVTVPLLMFIAAVVRGGGTIMGEVLLGRVSFNVVYNLRVELFGQLLRLPSAFFDQNAQGHIVSRLTFTVAQLRDTGTDVLKTIIQDSLKGVVLLAVMLMLDWQLTLIFIATAPVLALIVMFASNRFRRISRRIQGSMGDVTHVVSETVAGYRVVRTFGGHTYEQDRFNKFSRINRQQNLKMIITKVSSAQVNETVVAGAISVLVMLLAQSDAAATPGDAVAFLSWAALLGRPIRKLSEVNAKLQRGLVAAEDIFSQLDEPPEADSGGALPARAKGDLHIHNVTFAYTDAKPVLNNIDLRISAGETVALVGRSGSGKSTLASLIPRFYDVSKGRIDLDGVDIRQLELTSLRAQIALVSQQVTLFNDTLRNNIAYGDLAASSAADIQNAIDQAHASEFIEDMPGGLDTVVGDDGVLLSGGQRQRIAIARALLKDAPVLILDEATSALDNESERHIQAALEAVMRGRTTLVIAHRLSTVESADRIVVIDDGAIVETGGHAELLALDGVYAELHSAEFKDASKSRKRRSSKPVVTARSRAVRGDRKATLRRTGRGLENAWYTSASWLHLLRPLSFVYERGRRRRQRKNATETPPARTTLPVIVVGNISVGGTGKTPFVLWLAGQLEHMGFTPGVVSRGYGGALSGAGALVDPNGSAQDFGDEALLIRNRINVPVAIAAERLEAVRMLEEQGCDVAISDDGLQHHAMARDVEIVIVDGKRGLGNGLLLPAGPLREPASRLQSVDWVISNSIATDLVDDQTVMTMAVDGLFNITTNEVLAGEEFVARYPEVHAVCGIGNPERFFASLESLGLAIDTKAYPDHHRFSVKDLVVDDLLPVVVTEKDAVKIRQLDEVPDNLWYLRVQAHLPGSAVSRLEDMLAQRAILPRRNDLA